MTPHQKILDELKQELIQSLDHLDYSYNKILSKKISTLSKDLEDLETFEALVSRFARVSDIFIVKYLRTFAEKDDPAYRGSLLDTVHYAEKRGLVDNARIWIEIRELRNKIAHEYATKDLHKIFDQVLQQTPIVLDIRKKIS